ncbi:MAG: endolytic transglycosylase MltG [Clostridiales bacterium]|nr:endolytic transglycosylase MltG [Clostridiales bacterium]
MKKILSVLLVISLLFVLGACNNDEETETDTQTETSEDAGSEVDAVKVTIPEGYTLVRISWLLEEKGLCTSEEFIEAAQTYKDWLNTEDYPFLKDMEKTNNVCFYLEGYLFPLTHFIPKGSNARDILIILLDGTKDQFTDDLMSKVAGSKYNLHEILTIASIIEKEAIKDDQRLNVSSVLYNRLNAGMRIQCDVTKNYCSGVIKLIYPEKAGYYENYYDAYVCPALMAGPICNPGIASINAALSPNDTDYLYFVIGTVEPYESHFSKTYEEHITWWNANKARLTGQE